MSKILAKKFFNSQTTPEENKAVLEWSETYKEKSFDAYQNDYSILVKRYARRNLEKPRYETATYTR